jgi:FkbM family methyltransferase
MKMSDRKVIEKEKSKKQQDEKIVDYVEKAESIILEQYLSGRNFHERDGLAEYFREKRNKFKYFCIFGGGVLGTTLGKWLQKNGISVDFYCDNNTEKLGTNITGVPFISYEMLENKKEETFVMISVTNRGASKRYNEEINKQLSEFPFVMTNILKFIAYYVNDYQLSYEEALNGAKSIVEAFEDLESKELFLELLQLKFINDAEPIEKNPLEKYYSPIQYFTKDCYRHSMQERIVDCGAFNGDTLQSFLDQYGSDFERYHCFEMDKHIFKQLEERVQQLPEELKHKIILHPVGVYSGNRIAHYSTMTDTLGSLIDSDGEEETRLVSLDDELKGEKITLINMDIENSELQALIGAEKLIREHHPMLAISIYHSTEQFFKVPLYILEKFPFYKLYLRQHTTITDDTVLYAVPCE